jgi:tyrosyl-tRNA synthetase
MGVDIEVGGNDQLFNMLAGRHLVKEILNKEKFVITGKLLTTSDGAKMGKSEGNMIKLSDNATDIYGKVMAFPDEHIAPAFELLTDSDMEEVKTVEKRMKKENPMILKKELALKLTTELKGEKAAIKAQEQFEEIFQKNNIEVELEEKSAKGAKNILDIMTNTGISKSKSIARRLIEQGAVQIDGEKVTSWQRDIRKKEFVIKAGKKVVRVK